MIPAHLYAGPFLRLAVALSAFAASALACPACRAPDGEPDPAGASLPVPTENRLSELFPGLECVRELTEPFPCLAVFSAGNTLLGYIACSDQAGTTAEGFAGPVPVRVYLDKDGRILDFDVLDNRETPGYLAIALEPDFRTRMKDYRTGQEEPVDAVSLATITSVAIIEGITGIVDQLTDELISPHPDANRE